MSPLNLSGFAQLGRMLTPKYNGHAPSGKNKSQMRFTQPQGKKYVKRTPPAVANPIETVIRGLTSTLSQLTKKPVREDYNAVINGFLPKGAELLKPKYPINAGEYHLADIDGDDRSELVASYRLNDEVKTIVLKRQDEQWSKAAEINHAGHNALHFRGFAGITGELGTQLLTGLSTEGKAPTVYGYSLQDNTPHKMFSRDYYRLEVLNGQNNKDSNGKAQLAVWQRDDTGVDKIELLDWNGTQMEPVNDTANYYYRSVVPYYVRQIKQTPGTPSNWYNLANALVNTGATREALAAIEVGSRQDTASAFKDKFSSLKEKILGK